MPVPLLDGTTTPEQTLADFNQWLIDNASGTSKGPWETGSGGSGGGGTVPSPPPVKAPGAGPRRGQYNEMAMGAGYPQGFVRPQGYVPGQPAPLPHDITPFMPPIIEPPSGHPGTNETGGITLPTTGPGGYGGMWDMAKMNEYLAGALDELRKLGISRGFQDPMAGAMNLLWEYINNNPPPPQFTFYEPEETPAAPSYPPPPGANSGWY